MRELIINDDLPEKPKKLIIKHNYMERAINELIKCLNSRHTANKPRNLAMLGPSGSGKSTVIDEFCAMIEENNILTGKNIRILVIETPNYPTAHSMALEALYQLGDPLCNKGTEQEKTHRLVHLIEELDIAMVFIDEMQNLIDRESEKLNQKVAEWLKRLINRLKILMKPMVIVGLENTMDLFQTHLQLKRRFIQPYFMPAFDWKTQETKKTLIGFLKALQKEIKFADNLNIASGIMPYRFYCATGGLVGYIMDIVNEAKELSCKRSGEGITMEYLAEAYINVVCGNNVIGVNPFLEKSTENIEVALRVITDIAEDKSKKRKPRKSG